MKAIYLNGERFGSVVQALAYLEKRWGKRTDYGTLRRLADRDGILTAEGKRQIRVSWKAAGGETAEEWEGEEEAVIRKRRPLLRYPPGEGPGYEWSRGWR